MLDGEEAEALRRKPKTQVVDSRRDRAAYLAALARQEGEIRARVAVRLGEALTPREETFERLLWRFWDDATWMVNSEGFLGFFPNGKAKDKQHPWHLALWSVFIGALVQRANGVKPTDEGTGEADERTSDDAGSDGEHRGPHDTWWATAGAAGDVGADGG